MKRVVFVAWSRLSRRTRDIVRVLGIDLLFIPDPPPYLRAWGETPRKLMELKPDVVIVQLPQGPLLYRVFQLRGRLGYRVIADTHSGFLVPFDWKGWILNKPFNRLLGKTDTVLVHNEPIKEIAMKYTDMVEVIYDPLPTVDVKDSIELKDNTILLPASWAPDEPIDEIIDSYRRNRLYEKGYRLIITGDYSRGKKRTVEKAGKTPGVELTGYLTDEDYYRLVKSVDIILGVTRKEYIMLSAIWDSVKYDKPFIAPRTRTISTTIGENYPCLYSNTDEIWNLIEQCTPQNVSKYIQELRQKSRKSMTKLREIIDKLGQSSPN